VFPETRWQRDWVHKVANVLNALPASVQASARRGLREIWDAEDRSHAERALGSFARDFSKWPKAVAELTADLEALLPSTTTRPSTGSTCAPRTPSSRPSHRCGRAPT
jgi:transposase-like protein